MLAYARGHGVSLPVVDACVLACFNIGASAALLADGVDSGKRFKMLPLFNG